MEDNKVRELLEDRLIQEFENLENLPENGTKDDIIDNIEKLYKLKIEEDGVEAEKVSKKNQLKDQKILGYVTAGVTVVMGLIGVVSYDIWFRRGLRFEKEDIITSPMTKNLLNKLLPKK